VRIRDEFMPLAATMPGLLGLYVIAPDDMHLAIAIFWATEAERDRAAEQAGRPFYELLGAYVADASSLDGELLATFTRS
jgi:hypothetical protein